MLDSLRIHPPWANHNLVHKRAPRALRPAACNLLHCPRMGRAVCRNFEFTCGKCGDAVGTRKWRNVAVWPAGSCRVTCTADAREIQHACGRHTVVGVRVECIYLRDSMYPCVARFTEDSPTMGEPQSCAQARASRLSTCGLQPAPLSTHGPCSVQKLRVYVRKMRRRCCSPG